MDTKYKLIVTTPVALAALNGVEEFEFVTSNTVTVLHVHTSAETDGNEAWGMPVITTVTVAVAAERWCDGMDDDGDGEPVTDVADIAALLGCSPEGLAAHLDDMVSDRSLAAYEARYA